MTTNDVTAGASTEPADWVYYTQPSYVEASGLDVAYRRAGSGEPVLYLQGPRFTRRWLPFYADLSRDVDLVVPELAGFGDTPLPTWMDTFDDLVLHIDEVANALKLDRFHLVGHSIGAWAAAEFAVFYPQRCKSLTLLSPFGLRVPEHPLRDIFRLLPREIPDALFSNPDGPDELLSYGPDDETFVREIEESITIARLMWNPRYDYKLDTRLARVKSPALVLAPDDDHIVPTAHFDRWVELLPDARLQRISGSGEVTGHVFIAQEPHATAQAIVQFVKETL